MKVGHYSQSSPLANAAQFNDSDEGGLELGQVVAAIRRRLWIVASMTILVACAAFLKAKSEIPIYQAYFEILTKPVTVESEVLSSLPQTLSSREDPSAVTLDETQIKVLTSPRVLDAVVEQLQNKYPSITYSFLIKNLTIQGTSQNILAVAFQNENPQLVKDILDLVAKAFLRYSLEERQTDIRQGVNFVQEQIPQLSSRVETLQDELQTIRQRFNLVDPATTGQQLSSQVSGIEQQRLETQLQLDEIQSLYVDLQTELAQQRADAATTAPLRENQRYQGLLSQLQQIDSEIAKESVLFLDESPDIMILREQRENLHSLLAEEGQRVSREMASRIRELRSRYQALTDTVNRLNQQIKQLSVITREYSDIQRELQIATDNLNQFLVKREALRIDAAQREVPWQLLAPISEPKPSQSSKAKNLVLGAMLGLLLGLGAALLIDKLSNVVYTIKDLKEIAKLPLLGAIPISKEPEEFAPSVDVAGLINPATSSEREKKPLDKHHRYKVDPFYEAFRSLYTNIRLLGSDSPIRSLAVSSAMSQDGKSTVAVYLAQAAASMGQRVLLVDTDLRNPSVHDRMGLMNKQGLTDVISTDVDFNEVIQRSLLENNLFVMTAGPLPPDPIRLLASQKMQDLMSKLQAAFDLIIYDTPLLLGFADVYLVAAGTDGVVLVASLGKLKRSLLEQALDDLRIAGTPVLGAVANRSKDTTRVL